MMETINLDVRYSRIQRELFFPDAHFPKYNVCPKGRRGGLTQGAAQAFIEYGLDENLWFLPKGPIYLLWVDAINANIDKYYDRYFFPILRQLDAEQWKWKAQEKNLKVGRATIDFRSAEKPESIEGFGYHIIFLNEAGIILQDVYLYNNTILPMLMDFPDSRIIVGGTPKGKRTKNGPHRFFELYQQALNDRKNYRLITFTGRNNPFIDRVELEQIAASMDETTRAQEIDAYFVDTNENKFMYAFNEKHVIESYTPNPHLPLLVSFDFNKSPMCALVGQSINQMTSVIFDEIVRNDSSVEEVCQVILEKYKSWIGYIDITGDATGRNRSVLTRGNLNAYRIIRDKLMLSDNEILVPRQNPAHRDSQMLCNSVLQNATFSITKNCKLAINDMITANVDPDGELVKNSRIPLHAFDCVRYFIHCLYADFITNPERYH